MRYPCHARNYSNSAAHIAAVPAGRMTLGEMMAEPTYDTLADFTIGSFTYHNETKPIYRKGMVQEWSLFMKFPALRLR